MEEDGGFGWWVLGFDGKSDMGDLELDNLMREKEEEGGEAERLMIMVYFCGFLVGVVLRR